MNTPDLRVTGIGGTDVFVVTGQGRSGNTFARFTDIPHGTGIAIVTGAIGRRMQAAQVRVAHVGCTGIAVIAGLGHTGLTGTIHALVTQGAGISIIARSAIVDVLTACLSVAGIVGAGNTIITIDGDTTGTLPGRAGILDLTGIPPFAEQSIIGGHQRADAFVRVALVGLAEAFRRGTGHHGFRVNDALIRKRLGVADQCSIALIAVFQRRTIGIGLAVAGDGSASAVSVQAEIAHGADVTVVAGAAVGGVHTAALLSTGIVGAGVLVMAIHRVTDTGPGGAMVGHGTWVTIITGAAVEGRIEASVATGTGIVGAVVIVVAQVDIVAAHQIWLVHIPITVVVEAIAQFLSGH